MPGGIPNSLVALLGKVLGKVAGGEVKGDVKAMKAEKGEAGKGEKGAPLGDPGGHLLHGVGYATKDARAHDKNLVERENVNRFLEAQQPDGKEPPPKLGKKGEAGAEKPEGEVVERKTEAQETREARDKDVRREEQRDDARAQGRQEHKEQLEQRDQREAREKERERQDRDDQEERDKPGHGWVLEEADEEPEQERRRGLRTEGGVYDDNSRCKGMVEDGTRCLRKPVKGIGYCREHAGSWRPEITPKA